MEGWIFEMFFFAKLRRGGVILSYDPNHGLRETIKWAESECIIQLDLAKPPASLARSSTWRRPVKWNQGGYDAIFWSSCSSNTVAFVQVTERKTSSFKIEFFNQVLRVFKTPGLQVQLVDVYYVVPLLNMGSFRVSNVFGHGLLEPYRIECKLSFCSVWDI